MFLVKPCCGFRTCSRTCELSKSFLFCQDNDSVIILFVLTLEFCSSRWISECCIVQGVEEASVYSTLSDSVFMLEALASGVVVIVTFVLCAAAACLWWVIQHVWNAFPQHTNSTPAALNTHCTTDNCLCYSFPKKNDNRLSVSQFLKTLPYQICGSSCLLSFQWNFQMQK